VTALDVARLADLGGEAMCWMDGCGDAKGMVEVGAMIRDGRV
jgi:hypothetical protein